VIKASRIGRLFFAYYFWFFPKYSGQTHDNTLTTQGIFVREKRKGRKKMLTRIPHQAAQDTGKALVLWKKPG
jgi:hypothetical protein